MLPKGGVEDAIESRALSGLMRDNCHEVLNVLAAVFNVANAPHVRLYEMYGPNAVRPVRRRAALGDARPADGRLLTVAGYGDGLLSLVVR